MESFAAGCATGGCGTVVVLFIVGLLMQRKKSAPARLTEPGARVVFVLDGGKSGGGHDVH